MQETPNSESFNPKTDTPLKRFTGASLGWRWMAVALIFLLGLVDFANGVELSARQDVTQATILEQTY